MKIKSVDVYFVRPRWGFVEIVTDMGLTGWGEAFNAPCYELMGGRCRDNMKVYSW